MSEIPLPSSFLAGFAYDPESQQLRLRFQTGERYVYGMVPAAVVHAFMEAPSHGEYFNLSIRKCFPYRRLS
jgi:hypothetical protein